MESQAVGWAAWGRVEVGGPGDTDPGWGRNLRSERGVSSVQHLVSTTPELEGGGRRRVVGVALAGVGGRGLGRGVGAGSVLPGGAGGSRGPCLRSLGQGWGSPALLAEPRGPLTASWLWACLPGVGGTPARLLHPLPVPRSIPGGRPAGPGRLTTGVGGNWDLGGESRIPRVAPKRRPTPDLGDVSPASPQTPAPQRPWEAPRCASGQSGSGQGLACRPRPSSVTSGAGRARAEGGADGWVHVGPALTAGWGSPESCPGPGEPAWRLS